MDQIFGFNYVSSFTASRYRPAWREDTRLGAQSGQIIPSSG